MKLQLQSLLLRLSRWLHNRLEGCECVCPACGSNIRVTALESCFWGHVCCQKCLTDDSNGHLCPDCAYDLPYYPDSDRGEAA